ncbi:MAG TPA: maleylpyruvate isomerase N-terminal domain-containing protein [Ktedonobacterales bacterium]
MSEDWTALQERLAAAYASFLEVCNHLHPGLHEQGTIDGQWSLRDLVAHLTGWDHEATERFWRFLAGPTEDTPYTSSEINAFNARSVAARQHFSYHQAIKELRSVHRGLEEAIAAVQPEDLAAQSGFVGWLEILSEHYEEHADQLKSLIA